jgi:hypothetical protein
MNIYSTHPIFDLLPFLHRIVALRTVRAGAGGQAWPRRLGSGPSCLCPARLAVEGENVSEGSRNTVDHIAHPKI